MPAPLPPEQQAPQPILNGVVIESPIAPGTLLCDCNALTITLTSRQPHSDGRQFAKCPNHECKFFHWLDEPYAKCLCGTKALVRESKKGMSHNNGRKFLKCATGKCGFWTWEDGPMFGEQSQQNFNDWMDAGLYDGWED